MIERIELDQIDLKKRLPKSEQDWIPSEVSVTSFDGGVAQTKGIMEVDLTMGKIKSGPNHFIS